jgi:hypothetical protein
MSHDDGLEALSAALSAAGVQNALFHDCIHITLARGAGTVEIKSWAGDSRSAQVLRENESVNLVSIANEFDGAPNQVVDHLLRRLSERGFDVQATSGEKRTPAT